MSCTPPTITIDGIDISASDFVNSEKLTEVSGDGGDPTYDEYEGNIANGNNAANRAGMQVPAVGDPGLQTSLPESIPYTPNASNTNLPTYKGGAVTSCPIWDGIDYNVNLSPNFTLKQFSIGAYWKNQVTDYNLTYTKQVRFCNLMNLALNIAEPLYAKFGNMQINSGIRNSNSVSSGLSQHVTGQAIDVQFPGWSYDRYWENAQWVKDNIPYDQFIFEHSSTTGLAWYHLSFNPAGNRPATVHTKVMTMYRNFFDSGLKKCH